MHMTSESGLAENLKASLRGELITREDPRYEDARKVYNGMIDRRPRYIVRCADAADVISSVNFARENGLLLAVRGGDTTEEGSGSATTDW